MLNINGEEWKIVRVSTFHPKLRRSDGSFAIGSCDNNDKTIYIQEHLSPEMFKKVLCHELTHAAMFSYDIILDPM